MAPRLRLWLLFGSLALVSATMLGGALWLAGTGDIPLWLVMTTALVAIIAAQLVVWLLLERAWLRPSTALAREIDLLIHASAGRAIELAGGHGLGRLPDAVAALAKRWHASEAGLDAAVARGIARAREQQSRLEALLRDLSDGVIACSTDRRILLFNDAALRMLAAPSELGLDRPLDRLIAREPIAHAFELLRERLAAGEARGAPEGREEFVCATADGARLLRCRMALILGPDDTVSGFMLDFVDATERLDRMEQQGAKVVRLAAALRAPLATLRAAAEVLMAPAELEPEQRRAFLEVAGQEAASLADRLEALCRATDELMQSDWPMADLFSADLVRAVNRRLADGPCQLVAVGAGAWLRGDGYHLTLLLERLARRAAGQLGVGSFDLEARVDTARITLDLVWPGAPLPIGVLEPWLDEPLDAGLAEAQLRGPTLRDLLRRHGSELWSQAHDRAGYALLRLPLPRPARRQAGALAGEPAEARLPPRPEFYDFELLARQRERAEPLLDRSLGAINYVVFDLETTGLDPRRDRIIQIGGVRIVNRRLLSGEVFDALVDPGRPIARASIRFHGITDAMVAGRPPLAIVLSQFHGFARDAVLVAHNAAFDVAFLREAEAETGVSFDQPVLDTLLLSAVLHDHAQSHSLDAIAARFGIALVDRHRALGDAMGTAEILLRLLDLLEAAGITSLGAALAETERASELRRRQREQFGAEQGRKIVVRSEA